MYKIGIFGATGRVGQLLVNEILGCNNSSLASVYVRHELHYNIPSSVLVTKTMELFLESSQIIIDFSSPDATQMLLECAMKNPKVLVIGTTGLNRNQMDLMYKASERMPLLYSANMSEGVAILNEVVAMLSKKLKDYDIEISEIHHRYKKDSPSGTALTLAETIANARGLSENNFIKDREKAGKRDKNDISIVSLRGGDMAGRHTIGFYNDGEYLELTHNATSRTTFARGALRAALWLANKKSGLYSMRDIFLDS